MKKSRSIKEGLSTAVIMIRKGKKILALKRIPFLSMQTTKTVERAANIQNFTLWLSRNFLKRSVRNCALSWQPFLKKRWTSTRLSRLTSVYFSLFKLAFETYQFINKVTAVDKKRSHLLRGIASLRCVCLFYKATLFSSDVISTRKFVQIGFSSFFSSFQQEEDEYRKM